MTVILKRPAIFRLIFRLTIFRRRLLWSRVTGRRFKMTIMLSPREKNLLVKNMARALAVAGKTFCHDKIFVFVVSLLNWSLSFRLWFCTLVCLWLCRLWNLFFLYSLMTGSSRITRIFSQISRTMKIQRIFSYYIYTHASDSSQWRV